MAFSLPFEHSIHKECEPLIHVLPSMRSNPDSSCTVLDSAEKRWSLLSTCKWSQKCCRSDTRTCPTLCSSMDYSKPGFPVHHYLQELAESHVYWADDTIQALHPLPPSLPAFNLSQHQGLFQWVSPSHEVAKVLELQHQSFQWIFRTDFL